MKSKQIELNNKAGIYLRLSKDDEKAGESLSIENQRLILQKYAVEHGFEIVDEYIDDGYSGTSFERPEVQRLLEDAKTGRINIIIVKDLSRFGRNYIQVGQFVDYIFPMYNIRFIALSDNVDTADRNSSGMDMMPIMNVFNEFHSANTSKKIRTVIEANAKEGKYRVTYAPYGYIKGNDEHKLPIPNEPAASNVKRIFEMRAQGISPQKIADTFNNEGILTPLDFRTEMLGKPKRKTRHLWTDAAIKQIHDYQTLHNYRIYNFVYDMFLGLFAYALYYSSQYTFYHRNQHRTLVPKVALFRLASFFYLDLQMLQPLVPYPIILD